VIFLKRQAFNEVVGVTPSGTRNDVAYASGVVSVYE